MQRDNNQYDRNGFRREIVSSPKRNDYGSKKKPYGNRNHDNEYDEKPQGETFAGGRGYGAVRDNRSNTRPNNFQKKVQKERVARFLMNRDGIIQYPMAFSNSGIPTIKHVFDGYVKEFVFTTSSKGAMKSALIVNTRDPENGMLAVVPLTKGDILGIKTTATEECLFYTVEELAVRDTENENASYLLTARLIDEDNPVDESVLTAVIAAAEEIAEKNANKEDHFAFAQKNDKQK